MAGQYETPKINTESSKTDLGEEVYKLEDVEVTDDEDDEYEYQEVDDGSLGSSSDEESDNLEKLMAQTKAKSLRDTTQHLDTKGTKALESKTVERHEVVDDFVRNFFLKFNMQKTLETFENEWYELQGKGRLKEEEIGIVPDIYLRNENLRKQVASMKSELDVAKQVAENAKATWDKLRKERDFHRVHFQRVQEEKKQLATDVKTLKGFHIQHEDRYEDLVNKYERTMKDKMLLKLERDRLSKKNTNLQDDITKAEATHQKATAKETKAATKRPDSRLSTAQEGLTKPTSSTGTKPTTESVLRKTKRSTQFPMERNNPHQRAQHDPLTANLVLEKSHKGHEGAISSLALHPKKPILATVSDDQTWSIWNLPSCELIMSGSGHKSWISGVAIHPKGSHFATCSGDGSIRVWDFVNAKSVGNLNEHTQAVWSCAFHDQGDFLVSCSMDASCKLWDLNTLKSRHAFRGHVDSVNHVEFQPYGVCLATASGDKTVSLWDMRTALCVQTFYGHLNSINHVSFNLQADSLASSDADGITKVWDIRMVKERLQFDSGEFSTNAARFDRSGRVIAAATDDGSIKLFNTDKGVIENQLRGHEDAVLDIAFESHNKYLVSAGSDANFKIWRA
mmetsp:Transcript_3692/g.3995  ORF Transcript_3692/g.3995 Transcript_3692/m.3995 type:complete len:622 (-) Transcript_3692:306-2171(-)